MQYNEAVRRGGLQHHGSFVEPPRKRGRNDAGCGPPRRVLEPSNKSLSHNQTASFLSIAVFQQLRSLAIESIQRFPSWCSNHAAPDFRSSPKMTPAVLLAGELLQLCCEESIDAQAQRIKHPLSLCARFTIPFITMYVP